jgi:hypothetical protein
MLTVMIATNTLAQSQENPEEETPSARQQEEQVYHESTLRRFEIVTIIALPFTAIHSYVGVRGIQMIRQNEFAPELSPTDFKIIGASALSLALLIGFWDWLHTHDKNPSEELIPTSPQRITPPPRSPIQRVGQHGWDPDEPDSLVVPLVHIWF